MPGLDAAWANIWHRILQVDVTVDSVMLSPAVADLNHCLPRPYSTRPGSAPVCLP